MLEHAAQLCDHSVKTPAHCERRVWIRRAQWDPLGSMRSQSISVWIMYGMATCRWRTKNGLFLRNSKFRTLEKRRTTSSNKFALEKAEREPKHYGDLWPFSGVNLKVSSLYQCKRTIATTCCAGQERLAIVQSLDFAGQYSNGHVAGLVWSFSSKEP